MGVHFACWHLNRPCCIFKAGSKQPIAVPYPSDSDIVHSLRCEVQTLVEAEHPWKKQTIHDSSVFSCARTLVGLATCLASGALPRGGGRLCMAIWGLPTRAPVVRCCAEPDYLRVRHRCRGTLREPVGTHVMSTCSRDRCARESIGNAWDSIQMNSCARTMPRL